MKIDQKVKTIFLLLRKLIKKPSSIFLILKDETEFEHYLQKKYGKTVFPTLDIHGFLKNGNAEINNYTFLEGGSLITDLVLLKSIAATFDRCDYLEIGSWRGESIVNVADVEGANCISVNLSPEQIIARGLPEKYAREHGCLIKNRDNVKTVYADSLTFDFSTLGQKFDLIFVDGDHKHDAVKSDTKNVFRLLKDENSVIVWHDYGFDPVTPRYSVISAILDGLPPEARPHVYHVSNTMCAVYVRSEDMKKFIQQPDTQLNKVFKVNIESQKLTFNDSFL